MCHFVLSDERNVATVLGYTGMKQGRKSLVAGRLLRMNIGSLLARTPILQILPSGAVRATSKYERQRNTKAVRKNLSALAALPACVLD
jgi:hypothetical protein